jgi:hypothetical protein
MFVPQLERPSFVHIAPLEEQFHNSKNANFELCPQEVCLRPYLTSGIASDVYFLKWPREGSSVVVLLMRLHRPGQWFYLSPEKLYFSSCGSVLIGVRFAITRKIIYFSVFPVLFFKYWVRKRKKILDWIIICVSIVQCALNFLLELSL